MQLGFNVCPRPNINQLIKPLLMILPSIFLVLVWVLHQMILKCYSLLFFKLIEFACKRFFSFFGKCHSCLLNQLLTQFALLILMLCFESVFVRYFLNIFTRISDLISPWSFSVSLVKTADITLPMNLCWGSQYWNLLLLSCQYTCCGLWCWLSIHFTGTQVYGDSSVLNPQLHALHHRNSLSIGPTLVLTSCYSGGRNNKLLLNRFMKRQREKFIKRKWKDWPWNLQLRLD